LQKNKDLIAKNEKLKKENQEFCLSNEDLEKKNKEILSEKT